MVINGSQIKANAWESIKNSNSSPMLGSAFMLLLTGVSSSLGTISDEKGIWILSILAIVLSIVSSFIAVGYQWYCLNVSRNQSPEPLSMFEIFTGDRLAKVLQLWLLIYVKVFLWSLLLIVPGIIKSYAYSQSFYVLYDNPDYTASQCMKESEELMKGNKLEFFVFQLTFIGWVILGTIAMIVLNSILSIFLPVAISETVSMLVLVPLYSYMYVSMANFYNTLYMEKYNQY